MNERFPLPLTRAEEVEKKPLRLVRAAARIAIVAQWRNGSRCLFVRHLTKGLELPGGAIEPGETPLQAGVRELWEEAGIELPDGCPMLLIALTPVTDHRGGSWLDLIYGTVVESALLSAQREAELSISWLTTEEIEHQVDQQLSSYSAALYALREWANWLPGRRPGPDV